MASKVKVDSATTNVMPSDKIPAVIRNCLHNGACLLCRKTCTQAGQGHPLGRWIILKNTHNGIPDRCHEHCILTCTKLHVDTYKRRCAESCRSEESIYKLLTEEDILAEVRRINQLQCVECNGYGAAVGCQIQKCRKGIYHLPCALDAGCTVFLSRYFPSYCPKHNDITTVEKCEKIKFDFRRVGTIFKCSICQRKSGSTTIETDAERFQCVNPSCCSSVWVHRRCVERLFAEKGDKKPLPSCPKCHDQSRFLQYLYDIGIFLPYAKKGESILQGNWLDHLSLARSKSALNHGSDKFVRRASEVKAAEERSKEIMKRDEPSTSDAKRTVRQKNTSTGIAKSSLPVSRMKAPETQEYPSRRHERIASSRPNSNSTRKMNIGKITGTATVQRGNASYPASNIHSSPSRLGDIGTSGTDSRHPTARLKAVAEPESSATTSSNANQFTIVGKANDTQEGASYGVRTVGCSRLERKARGTLNVTFEDETAPTARRYLRSDALFACKT